MLLVLDLLLQDQWCVSNFLSGEKNVTMICDVCQCQCYKYSLYSQFQSRNLTPLNSELGLEYKWFS